MTKLEQMYYDLFENKGGSAKEMREINARKIAKANLDLIEKEGLYSIEKLGEKGFEWFKEFKDTCNDKGRLSEL